METTMSAAIAAAQGHGHYRSHKDLRPRINEGDGAPRRTTAHDLAALRAGWCALSPRPMEPGSQSRCHERLMPVTI
jgi:hypothetical protein